LLGHHFRGHAEQIDDSVPPGLQIAAPIIAMPTSSK
jgi:hypothetical protein